MTRPIKETPILFGEDARRFEARMKENHKVSEEEKTKIMDAYHLGLQILEAGKQTRAKGFRFSQKKE